VEEGVISKEKALDAIDGVVELARENEICQRRATVPVVWTASGENKLRLVAG
jgi:hypothetical protein